jgi:hypothetical protein
MLVGIFNDDNKHITSLIGREYAPGTLKRYKSSFNHTIDFMQWQYGKGDIDITLIDYEFITSYDYFLQCLNYGINNNFR